MKFLIISLLLLTACSKKIKQEKEVEEIENYSTFMTLEKNVEVKISLYNQETHFGEQPKSIKRA